VPFNDADSFRELRFPSILAASSRFADYLGRPVAKLAVEDLGYIARRCSLEGADARRRSCLPAVGCNDCGHGRSMIAIPTADDSGSLHLIWSL
jgi:hypothetical protein